jgi:hypothetical protein
MKAYKYILFACASVFVMSACEDEPDSITDGAVVGGLLDVGSGSSYVVRATSDVEIGVTVRQGPGVKSVEVYKSYCYKCALALTAEYSNEVLVGTLPVNGSNVDKRVEVSLTQTFDELREGLTLEDGALPTSEEDLLVGDFWEYRFVAIMVDGDREVVNTGLIDVAVANQYEGTYVATGTFNVDSVGAAPDSVREYEIERDLVGVSGVTMTTYYGDLGAKVGYQLLVKVNADNSLTLVEQGEAPEVSPFGDNSFDPETGAFTLNYTYMIDDIEYTVTEEITIPEEEE